MLGLGATEAVGSGVGAGVGVGLGVELGAPVNGGATGAVDCNTAEGPLVARGSPTGGICAGREPADSDVVGYCMAEEERGVCIALDMGAKE